MNRRGFLKALGAALAAPVVAKIAAPAVVHEWDVIPYDVIPDVGTLFTGEVGRYENIRFICSAEYGNSVFVSARGLSFSSMVDKCKDALFSDARKTLPKGTPFYVLDGGEMDYGNEQAFAWYYSPKPLSDERKERVVAEAIA